MKFRKKPVVIDAVKWQGENYKEVIEELLCEDDGIYLQVSKTEKHGLEIRTLEGTMNASVGDWIIKGVKGELYPCKPDIFEATYEKVEE